MYWGEFCFADIDQGYVMCENYITFTISQTCLFKDGTVCLFFVFCFFLIINGNAG